MRRTCLSFCGVILFLAAATALADPPPAGKPGPADPSRGKGGTSGLFPTEKIDVGGRSRDYRLFVPKSLDPAVAVPLVFAYHGFGDTNTEMAEYTQLDKLAEEHKFVLVYPHGRLDGENHYWNVTLNAARHDLNFFDEMYDRLTAAYNIDRNRVYATGISNGAFFVNLLASQRANKIAAIVSHSGGIGPLGQKQPQLPRKYPVMIVHGDKDLTIQVKTGRHCRDVYKEWEHPVEYIEIPGLNHAWALKQGINEKIWKFFEAHPLR